VKKTLPVDAIGGCELALAESDILVAVSGAYDKAVGLKLIGLGAEQSRKHFV
jgi:hypothetical protein